MSSAHQHVLLCLRTRRLLTHYLHKTSLPLLCAVYSLRPFNAVCCARTALQGTHRLLCIKQPALSATERKYTLCTRTPRPDRNPDRRTSLISSQMFASDAVAAVSAQTCIEARTPTDTDIYSFAAQQARRRTRLVHLQPLAGFYDVAGCVQRCLRAARACHPAAHNPKKSDNRCTLLTGCPINSCSYGC